jgi:hypothetical protein
MSNRTDRELADAISESTAAFLERSERALAKTLADGHAAFQRSRALRRARRAAATLDGAEVVSAPASPVLPVVGPYDQTLAAANARQQDTATTAETARPDDPIGLWRGNLNKLRADRGLPPLEFDPAPNFDRYFPRDKKNGLRAGEAATDRYTPPNSYDLALQRGRK